jgi:hypothetical protein
MYQGPWALPLGAYYHLDYVVFPTNVVLYGEDKLLVQYGWQDRETWVLELSLRKLISGMVKAVQGADDPPGEGE